MEDESNQNLTPKNNQDEMERLRLRAEESQRLAEQHQSKLKEIEEIRLKEKEDFKTLYEKEKEEKENLKKSNQNILNQVVYNEKYRAVYPALKKAGLSDEWSKLLDNEGLEDLQVETTSEGRYIVHGIETFTDKFKNAWPGAFKQKQTPNINSGVNLRPELNNENITAEMVHRAEKSGDRAKYLDLRNRYIQQRKKG